MSGGVDSSVAAYLTQRQGCECIGCTMRLYENEDAGVPKEHTCCSLRDITDARAVAAALGMRHCTFNYSYEFERQVIDKFVSSYQNGLTPNPCIDCNNYFKFNRLFDEAAALGCDYIVTGHYARVEREGGRYVLKKAADPSKDQSYVLYGLGQEELAHVLFPLGRLTKTEVREIAKNLNFTNAAKPDSQDICFVPNGDYAAIVELHSGKPCPPGDFVDKSGAVLGRHRGVIHYTIGQRKGLGLSFDSPRYVCGIDPAANTVTLGSNDELYSKRLTAGEFNWIAGAPPAGPVRCRAKIRYRQAEQPATATPLSGGRAAVEFDEPQRAITPGQAVVLYLADEVLGGGVIERG